VSHLHQTRVQLGRGKVVVGVFGEVQLDLAHQVHERPGVPDLELEERGCGQVLQFGKRAGPSQVGGQSLQYGHFTL